MVSRAVGILFKTTFHLPAKTFECIDVLLRVRPTSTVRIVTIYRPPSSGKNTTPFSEFITEFSHFLDRAATRPTEVFFLSYYTPNLPSLG